MSGLNLSTCFPDGLLRPNLMLGVISTINARSIVVNLTNAGTPSGSQYRGNRYGRGEVGEIVLIEGQRSLLIGRLVEVKLREQERRSIKRDFDGAEHLDALGVIHVLGTVAMDTLRVTPGVDAYPRLGDRAYAAPHEFVARIPRLTNNNSGKSPTVTIQLGVVGSAHESPVTIEPEKILGRHCAILGSTGGGKSWTTARLIEECAAYPSKLILIDATGEYRSLNPPGARHCHLGDPIATAHKSEKVKLPPQSFEESDFVALFEPAGKTQGPKLRAAIRSLRLATLLPKLAPHGFIEKIDQVRTHVDAAEKDKAIAPKLDDPKQTFEVKQLSRQIEQECVWPTGRNPNSWGGPTNEFAYCLSLVTRIEGIIHSTAFECVFTTAQLRALSTVIDDFLASDERLLRICLSGVAFDYRAREVVANAIGRKLLKSARGGQFATSPVALFVDEAHNFIGRYIGGEDYQARLDAFELLAREGRKFGVSICLASQRPRDITEHVLSQMGAMIVHRLTNDRDREVVERASSEIDRSASALLPSLRPGEAVVLGTDIPIPMVVRMSPPSSPPLSDGPDFQRDWV